MQPIRRILFAVRNPDATRQPGIAKAIRIARSFGASLELFHALASPVFLSLSPMTGETIDTLRARSIEHARTRLAKFVAPARKQGVDLAVSAAWDYPPHEAIVRRAMNLGADLIIAECHRGARTRAWLIHLTDWELLRTSPLPVLLLKNSRLWRRPVVLAAVDPSHAHAKPARLDADILAAALQFGCALHGRMHVLFANNPPLPALALGDPGINASTISRTYDELMREGREAFEDFMGAMDVEPARRHLVNGAPVAAIPAVARSTRAGLVVMGAVSRSGLKRVFIGNTAERVLEALPCDVLVVKPRGTKMRVAATPRGMRVVSQPATPLVA
jgi:universal stress protein E